MQGSGILGSGLISIQMISFLGMRRKGKLLIDVIRILWDSMVSYSISH